MKEQKTITISKLEYEQLQAESALMWEMTNDYGKQRDDGSWEHPFFDVIRLLHPRSAQRVIDADRAAQERIKPRRQPSAKSQARMVDQSTGRTRLGEGAGVE